MIKIDRNYTDYRDDTDPKYPGGKAVDATTAEGTDGTPLLANWMNDINGTRQAIFIEAFGDINGVSGKPDNVQESDILKAIKKITQDYTDNMLIKIFKNGYVQRPGMPSPLEDTSLHFEGYSWYEVNYDGNFFRAKGRNAKAFSTKRLTKEQIKNGDYIFQDDEQQDAIRNITGETAANREGHLRIGGSNFEMAGAFYGEQGQGTVHGSGQYTSAYVNLKFDASRTVPTAEENRSRNLTFTIWVLVKD